MNIINFPERLQHESTACYQLFLSYIELGENMSYEELAKQTNKPVNDIQKLAKRFDWEERITATSKNVLPMFVATKNPNKEKTIEKETIEILDKHKQLQIIQKMSETLNQYIELINEFDKEYITKEDDYEQRIIKINKVYRIFNLYFILNARIMKELEKIIQIE